MKTPTFERKILSCLGLYVKESQFYKKKNTYSSDIWGYVCERALHVSSAILMFVMGMGFTADPSLYWFVL